MPRGSCWPARCFNTASATHRTHRQASQARGHGGRAQRHRAHPSYKGASRRAMATRPGDNGTPCRIRRQGRPGDSGTLRRICRQGAQASSTPRNLWKRARKPAGHTSRGKPCRTNLHARKEVGEDGARGLRRKEGTYPHGARAPTHCIRTSRPEAPLLGTSWPRRAPPR